MLILHGLFSNEKGRCSTVSEKDGAERSKHRSTCLKRRNLDFEHYEF